MDFINVLRVFKLNEECPKKFKNTVKHTPRFGVGLRKAVRVLSERRSSGIGDFLTEVKI